LSFNLNSIKIHPKGQITLGKKAILSSYSYIESYFPIHIGSNFFLNKYSRIISKESITIGDHVTIAQFVSILDHDHDYFYLDGNLNLENYNTSPIAIGNNVLISDKVTICKGVTIGDNVIIGANSVVTKNIPSNCIVAGIPARIIKPIYE
jgi:maltose O-acetyltransferase